MNCENDRRVDWYALESFSFLDLMYGEYRGYMGIMEKKMEAIVTGYIGYRIWGIWGSYYNVSKAWLNLGISRHRRPQCRPQIVFNILIWDFAKKSPIFGRLPFG